MDTRYPSGALAGLKSEHYDPGIAYSVETPSGARYTLCRPAAAENSASPVAYFIHHWRDNGLKKRSED